jgi:hypothetical protein
MTKKDREQIRMKYGGRCAYCGCELVKGWHVDEVEPVRRRYKTVGNTYINPQTKQAASHNDFENGAFEYIPLKTVPNGCDHPERFAVENQNPACASCNINKHSMSLEDFRKLIAGFMKHLNEISTQYKIAKRYGLVEEVTKPVVFYFETKRERL